MLKKKSTFFYKVVTALLTIVFVIVSLGFTVTINPESLISFKGLLLNALANDLDEEGFELFDTPRVINVAIDGVLSEGSVLSGRYVYLHNQNIEEMGTTYRWLSSDSAEGRYTPIEGAVNRTYTVTSQDLDKFIKFEVKPRDEYGNDGEAVQARLSPFSKRIQDVFINGVIMEGHKLEGEYTYHKDTGDVSQDNIKFRWLRAEDAEGEYIPIEGAEEVTYTVTTDDVGKLIKFELRLTNTSEKEIIEEAIVSPKSYSGYSNDDISRIGRNFIDLLDLSRPDLATVKQYADRNNYTKALEAYRDYFVHKLRTLNFGHFERHDRVAPESERVTDIIRTSLEETRHLPVEYSVDYYMQNNRSNFPMYREHAIAYWNNGNSAHVRRVIQTYHSWARNMPRDAFPLTTLGTLASGACLSHSAQAERLMQSLVLLMKSLPSEQDEKVKWNDVNSPIAGKVTQEGLDLISPIALAEIATAIVREVPTPLRLRYLEFGSVPNQRLHGLLAIALIVRAFDDFKVIDEAMLPEIKYAFMNFLEENISREGGMLELSFTYNIKDYDKFHNIVDAYSSLSTPPPFVEEIKKRLVLYENFKSGLANQLGNLPRIGNIHAARPPRVWESTEVEKEWKSKLFYKGDLFTLDKYSHYAQYDTYSFLSYREEEAPPFTSVAFPYTGLYTMRTGWSMVNDMWLSFSASRRHRGHLYPNTNSLQVTAYGRDMLVAGGVPYYNIKFVSENQKEEYYELAHYIGEHSSLKANTVIVNGKSQNSGPIIQTTPSEPVDALWHSSDYFDLVDNIYKDGYQEGVGNKVTHQRRVIFLRQKGVWIVTDIMDDKSANRYNGSKYSQLWGFSPHYEVNYGRERPVSGYTNEQVVADQKTRTIRTIDTTGPNLWMYHFTSMPLEYKKYYGSKYPHFGWHSPQFGGERTPKVDIHVNWSEKAISVGDDRPDNILITAIAPTKTLESPVVSTKDLSQYKLDYPSGFEMVLDDNSKVSYLARKNYGELVINDIVVFGQSLLTLEMSNGDIQGMVLGCIEMAVGDDVLHVTDTDFEFYMRNGKIVSRVPVRKPSNFSWIETGNGIVPTYSQEETKAWELKNEEVRNKTKEIANDSVILFLNNPNVVVRGIKRPVDLNNSKLTPKVEQGRTLVPMRLMAEALGAVVSWNPKTSIVTIKEKDLIVEMTIGSKIVLINGKNISIDIAPELSEGITMIPFRAIAEALGKSIFWDERGLIIISDQEILFKPELKDWIINEIIKIFKP